MKGSTGTILAETWVLPAWPAAAFNIIGNVHNQLPSEGSCPCDCSSSSCMLVGHLWSREVVKSLSAVKKKGLVTVCVSGDSTLSPVQQCQWFVTRTTVCWDFSLKKTEKKKNKSIYYLNSSFWIESVHACVAWLNMKIMWFEQVGATNPGNPQNHSCTMWLVHKLKQWHKFCFTDENATHTCTHTRHGPGDIALHNTKYTAVLKNSSSCISAIHDGYKWQQRQHSILQIYKVVKALLGQPVIVSLAAKYDNK